ncbi:MAG: hypothetical protein EXS55_04460, partial [Candidatus Magasanikbacteria bacterium]|nr:hypothetical protein [Candidatus Magasanikbacteria bacterium]
MIMRTFLTTVFVLATLAGCRTQPLDPNQLPMPDMVVVADIKFSPDLVVLPDLTPAPDLTPSPDMMPTPITCNTQMMPIPGITVYDGTNQILLANATG